MFSEILFETLTDDTFNKQKFDVTEAWISRQIDKYKDGEIDRVIQIDK